MAAKRLTDDPARRDTILATLVAWSQDDAQVRAAQDQALDPEQLTRFVDAATRLGEAPARAQSTA